MSETRGGKRKKKRSFLQKQTRFGKQGRFGRGANLDSDMYQYFLRILEAVKNTQNNKEEMEMLASNLLEEIKDKEVEYAGNQLASRVIEELLPFTNDEDLCSVIDKFTENLRPLFSDPYVSHVLERIVLLTTQRYLKPEGEEGQEENKLKKSYLNATLKISRFCLNNLEDFVWDTYANHIIRTVLKCLSGNPTKGEGAEGPSIAITEFKALLEEFVNRLLSWPQFNDLANEELTSGLVQSLLVSTKQHKSLSKKIVKKICGSMTAQNLLLSENQATIRLVETVLGVANEKYYRKIYETCFKGSLKDLVLSKTGNFAVQKLINHCPNKELFEEIFTEVSDGWKKVLEAGHTGVLLALSQACRQHKAKQGDFYNLFAGLLDCQHPEDKALQIVPLGCCLTPHGQYTEGVTKVSLHGALIVQEMLQFNKPIRMVNSLLGMPQAALKDLLCDPRGSHIADIFFQSPFIGEKSREKLARKLEGQYSNLAMSKHGSRSLDAVWNVASIKQKTAIMEELLSKQSEVMANQFGRVIAYKVRLDYYRQNKKAWTKFAGTASAKEKFISEVLGPNKKIKLDTS